MIDLENLTKQVVLIAKEVGEFIRQERKNFKYETV
jgi:hypothetical protein